MSCFKYRTTTENTGHPSLMLPGRLRRRASPAGLEEIKPKATWAILNLISVGSHHSDAYFKAKR